MSTNAAASPSVNDFNQLKTRLKATWMTGNYDVFARYMEPDAQLFYKHIGIQPGEQLLDVGCGAGQLALIAARAGAHVTGCDISTNWIERARERAALERLSVHFEEGDAEDLPYADGQFDVVASLIGAMFAPRPDLVASEMLRVCRPGGKIAMANWTAQGFVGQMFKLIAKYIAPGGMPSPLLWGDEVVVRERLGKGTANLHCTRRFCQFEYPFPPERVVEFFRENYGPVTRAFAALTPEDQARLKAELTLLWATNNRDEVGGTLVDAEYLEVIAHRSDAATDISTGRLGKQHHSHRAKSLADRIEEGAARLEEYVRHLTEAQWNTPVIEGGKPGRTVGVVVNHVASMYQIEIQAAQQVAVGQPVTHITGEMVDIMNGKHAIEQASTPKSDTILLLRENSRKAAEAVRNMTDADLDRAAPFSLSFGAPVTAQFVIEDHALRHSWHHLARIRKAIGKKEDLDLPTQFDE
jgi:2-polyprenyl-3-methyl-5-hydroxy-6-metoxy-1,4-benzoquinol methylase